MPVSTGRDTSDYTWFPGRGPAGGAMTGVGYASAMALATAVVDGVASGWRPGLVVVAVAALLGTLVAAVPVFVLAGWLVRATGRAAAVVAYAVAGVVVQLVVAPLIGSAVGATPVGGTGLVVLVTISVVAAVAVALFMTRPRLPRTSGRLQFRPGGRQGDGVPGPSAAPAPASRYLAGGP